MTSEDCLFCKIIAGEIPSTKVYEDDCVYAFDDIAPMMPVHTLVIPKRHYKSANEPMAAEDIAGVFEGIRKVAAIKCVDQSGFRVVTNAGDDAQQTVHHVHFHVLGGAPMNNGDPSK